MYAPWRATLHVRSTDLGSAGAPTYLPTGAGVPGW
jgi:hypothetical protein